ncbi:MAG: hypothetical protein FWG37_00865 [Clostridia bacterium]|nr:hypothetical protein [Clostridia bacterium]
MRPIRRVSFMLLSLALALYARAACADVPLYTSHITVVRPGAGPSITLEGIHRGAFYTISLLNEETDEPFTLATNFHLYPETNIIPWDGRAMDGTLVPAGEYAVNVYIDSGSDPVPDPVPGERTPPAPGSGNDLVHGISQSTASVTGSGIWCEFVAASPGKMTTRIVDPQRGGQETEMLSLTMGAGPMRFNWDATIDGERVPPGAYSILLSYEADGGESFLHAFHFDVAPVSPPYSDAHGRNYWTMAPGETDNATIWEMLTQPITVYNNGHIGASGHTYLMENPDGTGKRIAQIHGLSQGLHVIGSENEHGYVLVEAFSNYDLVYQPRSAEDREKARELKQGYIEAKYLQRVEVNQEIGLVVDKLSQRMYVFVSGIRVTELIISTGFPGANGERMYRETIPGEFITVSYPGGFFSNEIFSDLGIRYNGGSLLHEVPCVFDARGRRQYSQFEKLLGTKASAGCIRIQRTRNPDGFYHRRLFHLLRNGDAENQPNYKIIIWDDLGRIDTPDVWYEAPVDRINRENLAVPELPV